MHITRGSVKTDQAAKYLRQLCKHFAHKVDVDLVDNRGEVSFPMGPCIITAEDNLLRFCGRSEKPEGIENIKAVIVAHLDKFAWRELPIEYVWEDSEDQG